MENEKEKTKQLAIIFTAIILIVSIVALSIVISNNNEWKHEQEMAKAGFKKEYQEYGRVVWVKQ